MTQTVTGGGVEIDELDVVAQTAFTWLRPAKSAPKTRARTRFTVVAKGVCLLPTCTGIPPWLCLKPCLAPAAALGAPVAPGDDVVERAPVRLAEDFVEQRVDKANRRTSATLTVRVDQGHQAAHHRGRR